jgi:hypothetical protein
MVISFLLLAVAGCGGKGGPHLAPVRGKVYFRQTVLSGGTVVFCPDTQRGNSGALARAEIQPDGSYVLQTDGEAGAAPGWHRVTVMAVLARPGGGPAWRLPQKYSDPEMSDITCEVKPVQPNAIDLHLD